MTQMLLGGIDPVTMTTLAEIAVTHIDLAFDFVRLRNGGKRLAARGRQRVVCLRGVNSEAAPARVPPRLEAALADFAVVPVTYAAVAGTGGRG